MFGRSSQSKMRTYSTIKEPSLKDQLGSALDKNAKYEMQLKDFEKRNLVLSQQLETMRKALEEATVDLEARARTNRTILRTQ